MRTAVCHIAQGSLSEAVAAVHSARAAVADGLCQQSGGLAAAVADSVFSLQVLTAVQCSAELLAAGGAAEVRLYLCELTTKGYDQKHAIAGP